MNMNNIRSWLGNKLFKLAGWVSPDKKTRSRKRK